MPGHEHHDGHETHGHADYGHGEHGGVVHAPSADAGIAYKKAFDAAVPDAGRSVVSVAFEAREVDWSIASGQNYKAWGFNGRVPGPTIEARVGDVLEVQLTNRLAEPTTIHWHGLRVPAAMDGTDMVQRPVAPGADVHVSLPAARRRARSGTTRTATRPVQLERGLYGALIVRGPDEPAARRGAGAGARRPPARPATGRSRSLGGLARAAQRPRGQTCGS